MSTGLSHVAPYAILGHENGAGNLVISCEHASNIVPAPLEVSDSDRAVLDMHWGWDIGAADVARVLVEESDSVGVFSTFSRLVCDPNRWLDDPTLIPRIVDGYEIDLNRNLDEDERRRRIVSYYEPYHAALDRTLGMRTKAAGDLLLLSVHSFTPCYCGETRTVEVGILHDAFDDLAGGLAQEIRNHGYETALNEPYSGYADMMPSAHRHGTRHRVAYLEIEIRQDLIGNSDDAGRVASDLLKSVAAVWQIRG